MPNPTVLLAAALFLAATTTILAAVMLRAVLQLRRDAGQATALLFEARGRLIVLDAVLESRAARYAVEVGDEGAVLTLADAPGMENAAWN